MSHDSAQFSPSFSLAKEAEIEYNPHVFWRGLRGFFSLPPRSGFVQPWNANNPPLRSGLSTFLFLLEVLRGVSGGTLDVSAGRAGERGRTVPKANGLAFAQPSQVRRSYRGVESRPRARTRRGQIICPVSASPRWSSKIGYRGSIPGCANPKYRVGSTPSHLNHLREAGPCTG